MGLQVGDGGLHVVEEARELDLVDVWHVLERFVAGGEAGGAPKVVNAQRVDTLFGEAESQFFVEVVEAAHVGADDDTWRVGRGLGRRVREVGGERGTVGAGKGHVLALGLAGVPGGLGGRSLGL